MAKIKKAQLGKQLPDSSQSPVFKKNKAVLDSAQKKNLNILNEQYKAKPKVTKAKAGKEMIERKDGSVSQRGLWDNLRSKAAKNKASGAKPKAPSKAMLSQEKKIKAKGK
jgi:hypothetical protein